MDNMDWGQDMGITSYNYASLGTLPIAEALRQLGQEGFIHVMGRRTAGFGTVNSRGEVMLDQRVLTEQDLEELFEIRAFSESVELRWLKDGTTGTAVLVSDSSKVDSGDYGSLRWETIEVLQAVDTKYFVWGASDGPTEGNAGAAPWSRLFDSRIGVQTIPGSHAAGTRAVIRAIEYITAEDAYGNAAVTEERWCGIETFGQEK
jgi:CRISPR-associated protein (TIGR03984 family)